MQLAVGDYSYGACSAAGLTESDACFAEALPWLRYESWPRADVRLGRMWTGGQCTSSQVRFGGPLIRSSWRGSTLGRPLGGIQVGGRGTNAARRLTLTGVERAALAICGRKIMQGMRPIGHEAARWAEGWRLPGESCV